MFHCGVWAHIVLYKFNITLSDDAIARTLTATTPQELYAYWDTGFTEARGRWVANTSEFTGSIRAEYETVSAAINVVPAPTGSVIAILAGTAAVRRRRQRGASGIT